LHSLGWSPQKPQRKSRERDEHAVEHWRKRHWPRLKKVPRRRPSPGDSR
jgi:hypothetical protein